jgi:3-deoxy-D-manno-octulosonic-acid transferase
MAGVYFLYSATLALLLLLTLPWWVVQMLRLGKYRAGLGERLGLVPARIRVGIGNAADRLPVMWVHAVSVGEVLAIAPLVGEMRAQGFRVVVSTTTHTGQRLARDKFGEGDVFYFPLDFGVCIRPYLQALRPRLVVLAETEFWPNFLRLARASGARLAVVNARISDRSLPRYRRWRGLLRTVLEPVDLFLAQSEMDGERLREVGAADGRVEVTGNLKFDARPPVENEAVTALGLSLLATGGPIVVAGSTVEDEEEYVLQAFQMVVGEYPAAVLVLAPRHRERFEAVARLLSEKRFRWVRRSELGAETLDSEKPGSEGLGGRVVLLDTLGELAAMYRYANLAFVGGSLVARGGHNILEPAFFGRPILIGPHTENFRDVVSCFERRRAVVRCTTKNLGITFVLLLRDAAEREALGQRAQQVLMEERGATARTVERLIQLMQGKEA